MAATAYETINVEREGAVATVRFNRPDALNAITVEMGRELGDALGAIAADSDIRAVVLTGEGRGFSAGADLKAARDVPTLPSGRPDLGHALRDIYNPTILQLREMPQPVIAAVNGPAVGIGMSYALACDVVVAARSSYFLLAFVNVALVPDGGASVVVPWRAGGSRALEMALLGEKVGAEDAHAWNLVNRVVDDEQCVPVAREIAAKLATGPREAQTRIKELMNAELLPRLRDGLAREADFQTGRSESDEVVEAIMAFIQKRPANFA